MSTEIKPTAIKNVLVLYVGGTVGMERGKDHVYIPAANRLYQKLKNNVEMHDTELEKYITDKKSNQLVLPKVDNNVVVYQLEEYYPLLDSSNMSTPEWIRIVKDIESNYENYNGFVILHGTDTLAYTASALSFMLENLQKPVILTGSQIPIFETRSDAKDNILSSLILAGCYNIPEVCIFFASKLLRGNRTAKISSVQLDAFDSPNYHTLADVGIQINVHNFYIRQPSGESLKVHTNLNRNVGIVNIFPTITSGMLKALLMSGERQLEGLVMETYGAGNIPSNRKELLEVLEEAVNNEVVIINVTQCAQGSVDASYETGKALENIGVISGHDMTAEAAFTKLCFVLGIPDLSYDDRVKLMMENIRGEFTNENNNNG